MLDHGLKDCLDKKEHGIIPAIEDLQYGAWRRGEPMRRAKGDSINPRYKKGLENRGATNLDRGMRMAKESHVPSGTSIVGGTSKSNLVCMGDSNIENNTRETDKLEGKSENYQGNGKADIFKQTSECSMIVLGKKGVDKVQCPDDKGDCMLWEKVTQQEESPRFNFKLATKLKTNERKVRIVMSRPDGNVLRKGVRMGC